MSINGDLIQSEDKASKSTSRAPAANIAGIHVRNVAILLFMSFLLWGWTYGLWDLWGPDEGRYVQIGKELLGRANWFFLTVHGEAYDQKPPLPFWMFALMLKLNGGDVSAWAVRFPPVFFTALALILTYFIGCRWRGARAGMLSALVLFGTPIFIGNAPPAELDMLYAGFFTIAIFAWMTRPQDDPTIRLSWPRAALLWGALAGAFFIKGPLALLIMVFGLAGAAWSYRSMRVFRAARFEAFLPLVALLIVAWMAIQKSQSGEAFVEDQVQEQTFDRFFAGDHAEPPYYYLLRIVTMLGPWFFVLLPVLISSWREWKREGRRPVEPTASLFGIFLLTFIFLSIAVGKRQAYMLPAIPAAALLVGFRIDDWIRAGRRFPLVGQVVAGLMFSLGALSLAAFAFRGPIIGLIEGSTALKPWQGIAWLGISTCMMVLGALTYRAAGAAGAMTRNLACFVALIGLAEFAILHPVMNEDKSTRAFSEGLNEMIARDGSPDDQLGAFDRAEKSEYHVYGKYDVVKLDRSFINAVDPGQLPDWLVGRDRDWRKLADLANEVDEDDWRPWIEQRMARLGYKLWREIEVSDDKMLVFHLINPAPRN